MARGWGRSEEDLQADKEQAREIREPRGIRRPEADTRRIRERRSLELALARIREQLPKVTNPERRRALETARAELEERLEQV
ncbi:MAG TPA: hypothetical protein VJ776_05445 [Thermoanaerobaculia bacterium]|nr:hypothetical protein [Thermoanaerobaculia bacterium]